MRRLNAVEFALIAALLLLHLKRGDTPGGELKPKKQQRSYKHDWHSLNLSADLDVAAQTSPAIFSRFMTKVCNG